MTEKHDFTKMFMNTEIKPIPNLQAELLPCPFCGGEARIIVVEKGVHSIIECTTHYCGFMRHSFNNGDTDEHAALRLTTAWNTRTPKERSEG